MGYNYFGLINKPSIAFGKSQKTVNLGGSRYYLEKEIKLVKSMDCNFLTRKLEFRLLDFKRFEIKRPNTYTTTIAITKGTAIVIAILVVVVN